VVGGNREPLLDARLFGMREAEQWGRRLTPSTAARRFPRPSPAICCGGGCCTNPSETVTTRMPVIAIDAIAPRIAACATSFMSAAPWTEASTRRGVSCTP
jgi:hypothetical protein